MDPIKQIIERQKETEGKTYIQVFGGDDRKKDKQIRSYFYDIYKNSINKVKEELDNVNSGTFGSFMNINPLSDKKRIKANIKKILYVFIDLDHANEYHNELIKSTLDNFKISYSYNAKSGGGYHFLIPVYLEPTEEHKVKGFLTYLNNNVCDKVDVAVFTSERLMRTPESWHFKGEEKQLSTLYCSKPTETEIKNNNENINKYQIEQKKGEKDLEYIKSIVKEDIFFSNILNNQEDWKKYYKILDSANEKNNIFIKNMGFFLRSNPDYILSAKSFLTHWQPVRLNHLEGWYRREDEAGNKVNYYELLKWANDYDLKEFKLLLEEQLKSNFLDDYEIYYLENEKKENAYLLYYVDKNYYVQKSIQEIILIIYYNCKEKGISLSDELNINKNDEWEKHSHKKKTNIIFSALESKLDQENRIKMVYNINYEPSEDKFIFHNTKRYFNTYTKPLLINYNKKQDKYHFPHIKELIVNLTGNEDKAYNYFIKWLSWIIQNPLEKLPTAIILQGKQGSGKGTLKNLVLDQIFGSDNVQEINQTHLESSFNEYLLGKQIIVANEVMHNENRQTLPNVLKNLVTDSEITISRKFRKEIKGNNYTHWIFCTNNDNPIKLDQDDRRYSVFFSEKLKGGGRKASKFVQDLRTNLDYELKEFISYLKSIKVKFYEVHEPIMTKAKEEIIELNKDSASRFVDYLKQFQTLTDVYAKMFGTSISLLSHSGQIGDYIRVEDLYKIYSRWSKDTAEYGSFSKQNFGKKISNFGLKQSRNTFDKKTYRVYNIQEVEEKLLK